MTEQTTIDTATAIPAGELAEIALADEQQTEQPRDIEAEARKHGWRPKEEFKGDPARWTDAETFVKRADEVMPFLEKKTKAQQREIDDLKRTLKQFQAYVTKADQRAMERATAEIEARHAEAVETGDLDGAKRAVADLRKVEKDFTADLPVDAEPAFDPEQARAELAEWVEQTGWYGTDDTKTKYADTQANLMGLAADWPGGQAAWLKELEARVDRRFQQAKPSAANAGGTRSSPRGSARSFSDLPPEAKRQCERFEKTIPGFTKAQYVKDYSWDN